MTDYSKITIQDIWESRTLNHFSKKAKACTLTERGKGLFVQTKEGDVLFDLRTAKSRVFLGHQHPLFCKINEDGEVKIPGKIIYALPQGFKTISEEDILLGHYSDVVKNENVIEEDLELFKSTEFFYSNKTGQKVWKSSQFDFYFQTGEETTGDDFAHRYIYHLKSYLEQFILGPNGKYAAEEKLFLDFASQHDAVKARGRYLTLDQKYSTKLQEAGIIHSLFANIAVLAYPVACLKSEIEQSFEIIGAVLKEE